MPGTLTRSRTAAPAPPATAFAPSAVDVVAHRGASALAPENTLAAVRLAHADGATAVECDVHRTRDGALVVHHDATLQRCTDAAQVLPGRAPWAIADLTLDDVRRVDAGRPGAPEPVPTLEEWVGAVGPRTGMLVEVKAPAAHPGIEHDLDAVLRAMPAARAVHQDGRLTVQSFDHAWLHRFKQHAPDVPVGALTARRPRYADLVDAASWAEQVNPRARVVTRALVEGAHDLGLRMQAWTVDEVAVMARLARWGVDGIITNHPARLVRVLAGVRP